MRGRPSAPARVSLGDAHIKVDGLTVTYRSSAGHVVKALESISLDLPPETFVAIVGPSGSGKSTLLYVLAGLLKATHGSVRVGERDLAGMSQRELARFRCANVGFVFQSFQLLLHLRAWENVALPMMPLGVPPNERSRRACALLSGLGLGNRINHRPGEMSAGEQQRTAIARAIVNSPTLILADEPTGNLDVASADVVADQLHALAGNLGATVVCATHDERLAARAARIVRVSHGQLIGGEAAS